MITYRHECCGQIHRIILDDDGVLTLTDHDIDEEETLAAFDENVSSCYKLYLKLTRSTKHLDLSLRRACERSNTELAKLCLALGADVHVTNDMPIRAAADKENLPLVKMLVEAGANIHSNDDAPLLFACEQGHAEMVEYFLNLNCNPNYHDGQCINHPVHRNKQDVVRLLLNSGKMIKGHVYTALQIAAEKNHVDMIRLILNSGAETFSFGESYVKRLFQEGKHEVAALLWLHIK